jgi:transposase
MDRSLWPPFWRTPAAVRGSEPEIALMWRFNCKYGIIEGFHNRIELIQRQGYGLRNFKN